MAILVSGGAGYIGSVTVHQLIAAGQEVVVLDTLEKGHAAALPPGVKLYQGSTGDAALVMRILSENRVDAAIHFAAYIEVNESVKDPQKYLANNIVNGIAFLDALVKAGVGRIVFSSSAAVYGMPKRMPIPEDAPKQPINPYGLTKHIFEGVLASYYAAYGLSSVSLRYFNAAGALPDGSLGEDHDPESHLIPLVIRAAMGKRRSISVFGTDYPTPDGTCVRDYIHVLGLADAHIRALAYLERHPGAHAFNVGTGKGLSVKEIIGAVKRVTRKDFAVEQAPRRPGDPPELVADPGNIGRELGWTPAHSRIDDIVASAWKWHSTHPDGFGG
ncbi:UDP-glucose 4-epimerase GalE [Candidatus Woesearchaeota archaeon]|nr:UDP-glucose 4-epimerase GalE [Candidatus Woesearchaeota archaeon]